MNCPRCNCPMVKLETVLHFLGAAGEHPWFYWVCIVRTGGCGEQILELPPDLP